MGLGSLGGDLGPHESKTNTGAQNGKGGDKYSSAFWKLQPQRSLINSLNRHGQQVLQCLIFHQVAVCAGCDDFYPWASFVIGILGGLTYLGISWVMLKLHIDDPLDSVAGISSCLCATRSRLCVDAF